MKTSRVLLIGLTALATGTGAGYYTAETWTPSRPFVQFLVTIPGDVPIVENATSVVYSAQDLVGVYGGQPSMSWPQGKAWQDPRYQARLPWMIDGRWVWMPVFSQSLLDIDRPGQYVVDYIAVNPINHRVVQWQRNVTVEGGA